MKFRKLILLAIVLVFNCFTALSNNSSPTGEQDSAKIAIADIRLANDKLIEGKYCELIKNEQDTIIQLQYQEILYKDSVITDFQNRIASGIEINNKLQNDYNKQKKISLVFGSSTAVLVCGIILSVVLNNIK